MLMELANEFLVSVIDCIPIQWLICVYILVAASAYLQDTDYSHYTHINSVKYSYIATGIHACSWLAAGI